MRAASLLRELSTAPSIFRRFCNENCTAFKVTMKFFISNVYCLMKKEH